MRTAQKDQRGGLATFTGFVNGGNASGSGMAGDLPYAYTRTATGDYTVNFDTGIAPVGLTFGPNAGQIAFAGATVGSGSFRVLTWQVGTATTVNANFYFTLTGIDRRR